VRRFLGWGPPGQPARNCWPVEDWSDIAEIARLALEDRLLYRREFWIADSVFSLDDDSGINLSRSMA